MATGFYKSQHAMIKCIVPPSAFRVQSAVSEISLVTHGQTVENTLGPIGVIVKMPGQSGKIIIIIK